MRGKLPGVAFPKVHETFPKGISVLPRGMELRDLFPGGIGIEQAKTR